MRRAALLLVAVAFFSAANCLGCIDNTGKNVSWWAKFKLPNSRDYYYSSSTAPGLKKASEDLSTATSPLWRTVNAGRKLSNPAYFYYNDETPDEVQAGSKAHAKGVIYVDTDASGFWLVHSVPRFPTKTQSDFPDWSIIYAQSFLCVSLKTQKEWASLMSKYILDIFLLKKISLKKN
jgi:deoxyribonuclease-2